MRRRLLLSAPFAVAAAFGAWVWAQSASAGASTLPVRLSDQAYWRMIEQFSEPNGYFRSDNLVSNEDLFQTVIPRLQVTVGRGGVYVGVGPDQNYTYIAAVRPRIAFIPDIRRGNLLLHLMYKALFELSANRAEFLSRLFSRPRPPNLGPATDVEALFDAYATAEPDRALFQSNLAAIAQTLLDGHGFRLSPADLAGIDRIYSAFFNEGPFLSYSSNGFSVRGRYPTFQDLQLADDGSGVRRSYLATEEQFRLVRGLHQQNLIVPLVGTFAGPKTLQAVGEYVTTHRAVVTVFYTSNVEQYLFQDGLWSAFMRNVRTLPIDETSTFIRSCFNNCARPRGTRSRSLLDSVPALLRDARSGEVASYGDVLARSR
jgi:hypothetical protein